MLIRFGADCTSFAHFARPFLTWRAYCRPTISKKRSRTAGAPASWSRLPSRNTLCKIRRTSQPCSSSGTIFRELDSGLRPATHRDGRLNSFVSLKRGTRTKSAVARWHAPKLQHQSKLTSGLSHVDGNLGQLAQQSIFVVPPSGTRVHFFEPIQDLRPGPLSAAPKRLPSSEADSSLCSVCR